MIRSGDYCVCFTEAPLMSLASGLVNPSNFSRYSPFGGLWYTGPNGVGNAIDYAKHSSRSHPAVIRVYDASGNVIETHEHKGTFREP
jgi:hypothetical protein